MRVLFGREMPTVMSGHSAVFNRVVDAVKKGISDATGGKQSSITEGGMRKALTKLGDSHWLSLVLKVALNRRKFGTAETPDGMVFTATQLHNHLVKTEASIRYQDSICLALFLTGELSFAKVRESLEHMDSGFMYMENGEDSEEDNSDDEGVTDSEGSGEAEEDSDDEGTAASTPRSSASDLSSTSSPKERDNKRVKVEEFTS